MGDGIENDATITIRADVREAVTGLGSVEQGMVRLGDTGRRAATGLREGMVSLNQMTEAGTRFTDMQRGIYVPQGFKAIETQAHATAQGFNVAEFAGRKFLSSMLAIGGSYVTLQGLTNIATSVYNLRSQAEAAGHAFEVGLAGGSHTAADALDQLSQKADGAISRLQLLKTGSAALNAFSAAGIGPDAAVGILGNAARFAVVRSQISGGNPGDILEQVTSAIIGGQEGSRVLRQFGVNIGPDFARTLDMLPPQMQRDALSSELNAQLGDYVRLNVGDKQHVTDEISKLGPAWQDALAGTTGGSSSTVAVTSRAGRYGGIYGMMSPGTTQSMAAAQDEDNWVANKAARVRMHVLAAQKAEMDRLALARQGEVFANVALPESLANRSDAARRTWEMGEWERKSAISLAIQNGSMPGFTSVGATPQQLTKVRFDAIDREMKSWRPADDYADSYVPTKADINGMTPEQRRLYIAQAGGIDAFNRQYGPGGKRTGLNRILGRGADKWEYYDESGDLVSKYYPRFRESLKGGFSGRFPMGGIPEMLGTAVGSGVFNMGTSLLMKGGLGIAGAVGEKAMDWLGFNDAAKRQEEAAKLQMKAAETMEKNARLAATKSSIYRFLGDNNAAALADIQGKTAEFAQTSWNPTIQLATSMIQQGNVSGAITLLRSQGGSSALMDIAGDSATEAWINALSGWEDAIGANTEALLEVSRRLQDDLWEARIRAEASDAYLAARSDEARSAITQQAIADAQEYQASSQYGGAGTSPGAGSGTSGTGSGSGSGSGSQYMYGSDANGDGTVSSDEEYAGYAAARPMRNEVVIRVEGQSGEDLGAAIVNLDRAGRIVFAVGSDGKRVRVMSAE